MVCHASSGASRVSSIATLAASVVVPLSLALSSGAVHAQAAYPAKPVRIIVPYAAGGSPDTFTRILVKSLEPRLKQPVLVENKPGANSVLGMAYTAKQAPDGYTITYATNSGLSSARALFKNLNYDPINDFSGIILAQDAYFALMVRNEEKGTSFAQYLEKMRRNPEKYSIGGASTTMEILNKMIETAGKTSQAYARYANPAVQVSDLLGGRLGGIIHTMNASINMHRSGQAHAIAVSAPERLNTLPDVPTMVETLPGVTISTWTGFWAPAKTPRPIVDYLYQQFVEVLKNPEAVKYSENVGKALAMPPAEVDAFVRKEEARWNALAKAAGISPE
jgi:tripartite-type tricarboxylate transporter receptor subunit TctC